MASDSSSPPPVEGIHSKPTGLFTDEDFTKAALQVQNPDFEGWEFFVESMGVKMYRKYSEVSQSLNYNIMLFLLGSVSHYWENG